jgi:hypothetical protein
MVVESSPVDPDREAEYNEWYSGRHIPEICAITGFVGARRYKVRGAEGSKSGAPKPSYLAIYELEADDLDTPLQELASRSADGRMAKTDALRLSPPPVVTLYELIE